MKQLVGYILAVGGGLFMAWALAAGGSFTMIYTVGCVGTSMREACSDIPLFGGLTLAGTLLGWLVYRAGRALIGKRKPRPTPG